MSGVAHRAYALVPSEASFEGLTKRLLALRAEIDAILTELAGQAMAMRQTSAALAAQPAAALTLPAEEPAAAAEPDLLPALSDPAADGESEARGCSPVEAAQAAFEPGAEEYEILEPSEMTRAEAPEQFSEAPMALEPIEAEQDERTDVASLFDEAEVSPAADATSAISATEAVSADLEDAAILDTPRQSAPEATETAAAQANGAPTAADDPHRGDSPVMPTARAAAADAVVVSLNARQRKHKGGLAIDAPMPARSARRLAAKIAACILVLLTAASVLVMADRTAFGGVQSLPWMSPAPSGPTGIDWLLQRIRDGAVQSSDDAAAKADLPLDDGPLSGHPVAWGS